MADSPYPAHGSENWDGPLQEYVDDVAESQIAFAIDLTNTAYTVPVFGGAYVSHGVGLAVSVPPTDRPVKLEWQGIFRCTAAGSGALVFGLADTTDGVIALTDVSVSEDAGLFQSSGVFSPSVSTLHGGVVIDPLDAWRYYHLVSAIFRDSGSLAFQQLASGVNGEFATYLRAVRG